MHRRTFVGLLLLIGTTFLLAVFPENEMQNLAQQNQQQEPAQKFNILHHKYRNYLLTLPTFRRSNDFILKLQNQQDNMSVFLYRLLSDKTQRLISAYRDASWGVTSSNTGEEDSKPPTTPDTFRILRAIMHDVNPVLVQQIIYQDPIVKEAVAALEPKLSQDTKAMIVWYKEVEKKLATIPINEQTVRFNRLLLEEAYPQEIAPLRRIIQDERGILAQAKPTTLDETSAEAEYQRFLAMYEGKTFAEPLPRQKSSSVSSVDSSSSTPSSATAMASGAASRNTNQEDPFDEGVNPIVVIGCITLIISVGALVWVRKHPPQPPKKAKVLD